MNQPGNENDHANTMRSLWCRLIDGAELSNDEAAAIRDHLQTNDTLRSEIGTDATMHALLRSTHDVRQSEDQFVRGVLGGASWSAPSPRHRLPQSNRHFPS